MYVVRREREMMEQKLREYIDANLPIVYVVGYDEINIMEIILKVTENRKVWEWNALNGLINRKNIQKDGKESVEEYIMSLFHWKERLYKV